MTLADKNKFLQWVNEHDIRRNANLITITNRKTKEILRVIHTMSTEESERQLQEFLDSL
jgi:hypothetical protein